TQPYCARVLGMTRAALYLRQSQDRDDTQLAVDRQRDMSQGLCKTRGWDIVHEYLDNDVSATKSRDVAEFVDMVADANAGRFDVVVASEAERFARRLSDLEYLVDAGVI